MSLERYLGKHFNRLFYRTSLLFRSIYYQLDHMELKIMATKEELVNSINKLTDQITKIGVETTATLQKVTELEEAIANADTSTPEIDAALAAALAAAQAADDKVADAATEPPPPMEPPVEPPLEPPVEPPVEPMP